MRWIGLTVMVLSMGCGAARVRTAAAPPQEMSPWQAYEASRPKCTSRDEQGSIDQAARRRVSKSLEYTRSIGVMSPEQLPDSISEDLDSNYKALLAEGTAGRRVVREAVLAESELARPNSFFLMDMGHFLVGESCADNVAAAAAYRAIAPSDPVVRMGSQDLFEFGHALSIKAEASTLPAALRMVMAAGGAVSVPAHATTLDATLQGVFLLGPYGRASEAALAASLDEEASRDRALEILSWIGSPASTPAVVRTLRGDHDHPTFVRALTFLMSLGGAEGRHAVQSFDAGILAEGDRALLVQAQGASKTLSFEKLRQRVPGGGSVPPARALRERFARMIANAGRDDTFEPSNVLDSDLPRQELGEWLQATRAAQLRRLSDEALSDVEVTNMLLLVLSFRDH